LVEVRARAHTIPFARARTATTTDAGMDSSSASVRAVSFASKGARLSHLAFPSKAETEEKATNIVQLLDDAVFKYLQPELKLAEADKQKEIVKKTRAEKYRDARKWSELSIALASQIETRYGAFNVSDVTADEVAERVVRDVRAVLNPPKRQMKFSENLRESVKAAFTGGESTSARRQTRPETTCCTAGERTKPTRRGTSRRT